MSGKRPWTIEEETKLIDLYGKVKTGDKRIEDVAREMGRPWNSVSNKAQSLGLQAKERFRVERIPSVNRTFEEILADQVERFKKKSAHHGAKKEGVTIELDGSGPYALVAFGDPHGDDDGFDVESFAYCVALCKSDPNVFAFNLGDLTNNWIGSLARLWGTQTTTSDESQVVADGIVGMLDWLFVILGNHDKWTTIAELACKRHNVQHVSHGAVFKVVRDGVDLWLDARHTHRGNSMYNPSHAQVKKNYRGSKCDIVVGAHTHTSGYTKIKNGVTGVVGHCVRVGAFKRYDDYADTHDFEDGSLGPAVMFVIDPAKPREHMVTVFDDLDAGLMFLNALRMNTTPVSCRKNPKT